jgi:hypothetical protein
MLLCKQLLQQGRSLCTLLVMLLWCCFWAANSLDAGHHVNSWLPAAPAAAG